jgi:hypothetical protein
MVRTDPGLFLPEVIKQKGQAMSVGLASGMPTAMFPLLFNPYSESIAN